MSEKHPDIDECLAEGPQSALEKNLMKEYLQEKGYNCKDLLKMPTEIVRQLRTEACTYASLKLAEIEAKTQFKKDIHYE